jgi:hypothetical protein
MTLKAHTVIIGERYTRYYKVPVKVAARSKALVRGRSPAAIAFESHREHGCMSVVSVVCCHVEVFATS